LPILSRLLLVPLVAGLAACGKPEPLAPELQSIRCPTNRPAHASATFANARITFVCIGKELAEAPHLLRCDLESRPMVCEDEGSLVFTRSAEGTVFAGYLPTNDPKRDPPDADFSTGSRLVVNFRKGPPRTPTFEEVETDWRFLLPDAQELLPAGFALVKGALCDREATVLNAGGCNIEARSASLYWHIAVYLLEEKGTPMAAEDYRTEIAFWRERLGRMVVDPAGK
jgi:hypothetical protein